MSGVFDRSSSRPASEWRKTDTPGKPAEATYIVLGNPHGGTTLVAGLLRILGVFMGRQLDTWTQEDILMRTDNVEQLQSAVESRNAEFKTWGWKCPGSTHYLDSLKSDVRKPRFIVIFRDPYATMLRRVVPEDRDPVELYEEWIDGARKQLSLVKDFDAPTLFISYEMALKKPEALIEDLSQFVHRSPPTEEQASKMLRYIKPDGGYGFLQELTNGPAKPLTSSTPRAIPSTSETQSFETLEFVRPQGIAWQGNQWLLENEDPWCFVKDADILRLPKCSRVRIDIELSHDQLSVSPSMYLDTGYGLCETHRIEFGELSSGSWEFEVEFPETLGTLRFDPDEKRGTIEKLSVSIA